jgi:hypothetical protein
MEANTSAAGSFTYFIHGLSFVRSTTILAIVMAFPMGDRMRGWIRGLKNGMSSVVSGRSSKRRQALGVRQWFLLPLNLDGAERPCLGSMSSG